MMRLDKFLCDTTSYSRKELKDFIKSGKALVNGKVIKDNGFQIDENHDDIVFQGKKISFEKYVYFMLNKPADYVSANTDNVSKTVIDLFKSEERSDLFTVGRLDKDTVGLLIVTNDGALAHHLTSPKHHVGKTYFVRTEKPVDDLAVKSLAEGVLLDGDGMTKPAIVERLSENEINLTIYEGMFHQVKRMLAAVDNKVIYLKRLSIGEVYLDKSLAEGEYRRLTEEEINILRN